MVLLPAIESASTAIFMPRYKSDLALEMIADERITLFGGTPTIYNGLIKHDRFSTTIARSLGRFPVPRRCRLRRFRRGNGPLVFRLPKAMA